MDRHTIKSVALHAHTNPGVHHRFLSPRRKSRLVGIITSLALLVLLGLLGPMQVAQAHTHVSATDGPCCSAPTPIPTPIKNAILSVTTSVTPKTPMWNIDAHVTLDPTQIACPAPLTVTIAGSPGNMKTTVQDVCAGQANAPSQTDVFVPVFDPQNSANDLRPSSPDTVTAQLTDANNQQSSLETAGTTPPAPIWIGLGDSFSSGYHQFPDDPYYCWSPNCYNANDINFSWLLSAEVELNEQKQVPNNWLMNVDMEAQSGDTTVEMVASQVPNMENQLAGHQGSWNVVSILGGADDLAFSTELKIFYATHSVNHLEPWDVKNPVDCVNTQSVWQKLQTKTSSIVDNLNSIVSQALKSDPNVRIAAVEYPYVLDTDNTCAINHPVTYTFPHTNLKMVRVDHGATSVIDGLDSLDNQITGSNIAHIDLRTAFGDSPVEIGVLQLLSVWGYPHPNENGQQAIANAAVQGILGL